MIFLASSDEVAGATGKYFYKCFPKAPTAAAQDDDAAKRLWTESMRIAGWER
jgi:retinol dehydrogenase-12